MFRQSHRNTGRSAPRASSTPFILHESSNFLKPDSQETRNIKKSKNGYFADVSRGSRLFGSNSSGILPDISNIHPNSPIQRCQRTIMNKIAFIAALGLFSLLTLFSANQCLAQWGYQKRSHPHYLVLRTPTHCIGGERAGSSNYPGYVNPVTTNAYAYGWFGATARPNGRTVSNGYYRHYIQWANR